MAKNVRAEMVANVWKVTTKVGAIVNEGDTLVILESMKMEIPVVTEDAGTVLQVAVKEGDNIQEGDLIAVIGTPEEAKSLKASSTAGSSPAAS